MQPGDSGGENGGMDTEIRQRVSAAWGQWWKRTEGCGYGDKTEGECSLGTVVEENGGMDTEIRQRVSAAWGQWWKRTEVWIRR